MRITFDLTDVAPELTDDIARFLARANCLAGIAAVIHEQHGETPHASIALEAATAVNLSRKRSLGLEAQRLLRIAWQTEMAARLGSAFDDAALLRITSQTLPVNAYYALYNALRALALAEGRATDKHTSVQDMFAKQRAQALPVPWCATLSGDPASPRTCTLFPSALLPEPEPFNPIARGREPNEYLWAALRTTRRWKLELLRDEWLRAKANRKADGSPRRKLPPGMSRELARLARPTSLLDFLYEMRRRANYQTADEYSAEVQDADVQRFHHGIELLLDTGMLVIEAQIARRTGVAHLRALAQTWTKGTLRMGPWAAERLKIRMDAIQQAGA